MLDGERRIGQAGALRFGHHRLDAGCRDAAPGPRQGRKPRSVAVDLRHIRRQRPAVAVHDLAEALRAGEIAVQIVEGAILGVDDDDGLDLRLQRSGGRVSATPGGASSRWVQELRPRRVRSQRPNHGQCAYASMVFFTNPSISRQNVQVALTVRASGSPNCELIRSYSARNAKPHTLDCTPTP